MPQTTPQTRPFWFLFFSHFNAIRPESVTVPLQLRAESFEIAKERYAQLRPTWSPLRDGEGYTRETLGNRIQWYRILKEAGDVPEWLQSVMEEIGREWICVKVGTEDIDLKALMTKELYFTLPSLQPAERISSSRPLTIRNVAGENLEWSVFGSKIREEGEEYSKWRTDRASGVRRAKPFTPMYYEVKRAAKKLGVSNMFLRWVIISYTSRNESVHNGVKTFWKASRYEELAGRLLQDQAALKQLADDGDLSSREAANLRKLMKQISESFATLREDTRDGTRKVVLTPSAAKRVRRKATRRRDAERRTLRMTSARSAVSVTETGSPVRDLAVDPLGVLSTPRKRGIDEVVSDSEVTAIGSERRRKKQIRSGLLFC
ncbi:hypothetical protein BJ508DRAFT_345247 [Ascobolus immersus RN42]|uniref:Uncharacterized protein n=1 Tax=Ascobolus immersus RN42 TaxID=1160509 RepID=A0A3N4HE96_ASCIM|nr:hypothetical protein BJ508DRAFT_345247 [Ascobolus immersus RN42]